MLALDVLLLCMIVVCIIYCWVLNQRIRDLHNSRIEFARMIKEFDAAVLKAEHSIDDLSNVGKNANSEVKKAVKSAEMIIEDLESAHEIGDKTCSNLEAAIAEARKCQKVIEKADKDAGVILEESNIDKYDEEKYIEDAELPEHKNLIEKVIDKITTHKHKGTADQSDFYNSLRKLSIRK